MLGPSQQELGESRRRLVAERVPLLIVEHYLHSGLYGADVLRREVHLVVDGRVGRRSRKLRGLGDSFRRLLERQVTCSRRLDTRRPGQVTWSDPSSAGRSGQVTRSVSATAWSKRAGDLLVPVVSGSRGAGHLRLAILDEAGRASARRP